jgi:hypothetical protein
MTDAKLLQRVRDRAWHFLGTGPLSPERMQQLVAGTYHPTPEELRALCQLMSISPEKQS